MCHQPSGTKIVSPGSWMHSIMPYLAAVPSAKILAYTNNIKDTDNRALYAASSLTHQAVARSCTWGTRPATTRRAVCASLERSH